MARREAYPKSARLRSKREIDRVFEDGMRVRGKLVTIVASAREGPARFAPLCGKRFSKKATERNYFRRLAKEAARRADRTALHGLDIVILPQCKPEALALAALRDELDALLALAAKKVNKIRRQHHDSANA